MSNAYEAATSSHGTGLMTLAYAITGYVVFLGVFTGFIVWALGVIPAFSVDGAPRLFAVPSPAPAVAVAVNLGLIALFGLQHSIMARQAFKRWLTRHLPQPAERATYVWAANVALALVILGWQPLPEAIWRAQGHWHTLLLVLNIGAWTLAVAATWMVDHFDLFGLKQAWNGFRDRMPDSPRFIVRFAYRFVRHPLMTGIVLGLWIVPAMSWGHLILSTGLTAYILIGTRFEERDLIRLFGERYRRYREQVPMLFPRPGASVKRDS